MWNYRCIFIHIYTGEYNINNIYIVQILNTSISRSRNVASHKGDYIYIYISTLLQKYACYTEHVANNYSFLSTTQQVDFKVLAPGTHCFLKNEI